MDFTQPYTVACFALIPSLQLYVLAQAFRFVVQHASPDGAGSLGYKLVTYCEQPPGCPEKILDEMDRAHREGAQTIVTIFYAGMEPTRLLFVNVLQVEINLSQIRIHHSMLKMNFRGALPSILGLLKAFQWNMVGFIHRYELEFRDVIAGLEQSDRGEICIEFTEQSIFDGRKLIDKISSSKSNVTLVMDESALYYMSRAGQEENRTMEKHIIHCCYGVTFGLAGLEYKLFRGVWSLHQRPRLVPGFLDYLLDTNTHRSANATVGYLFRKVCHQCTANPSSEHPCRNFNNPVPVNTSAARLSHHEQDICLGAPAINMCNLCLDRLAYLDVIFVMDLFTQKLARAIEERSQNYPPSQPQNSSDFNGEQLEQFLIDHYSPLLPINPNPFEVFYWNVTDDGEVKLPQVDVDVQRAASDSYDPVARTVGLRGGGAIRILPSHCSRGCGQGEVQKLHPDLPQHCCYACEVCSPGTYSNGSASKRRRALEGSSADVCWSSEKMSRFLAGYCLLSAWLLYPLCCSAQTESSTTPPGNCGPSQFLDIEAFQCSPCGEHLVKSPAGLRCVRADGRTVRGQASACGACVGANRDSNRPFSLSRHACAAVRENSCNLTACELLTNMVVLNTFSLETRAYNLYAKAESQNLPKLFYSNTGLPPLSFGKNSKINFKLVKYDAQGNFFGWEDVTGGTLQLCADRQNALDAAYSFGTSYEQSCTVQVSNLLRRVPEPVFYGMFLQFFSDKGNWLWPVPVANPQLQLNSPASLRSQRLRRFFLVDGLSGRQGNLSNQPTSVTLAAELLLSVDLPTSSPGDQSAFLLTVKYAKQDSTATAQVSFAVSYTYSPGTSQRDTDIALAILGALAALYALLKTSSWVRRSRLQNISFTILVKFFAFFAGALANTFFVVALGMGIYWLIVFKGQKSSAVEVMVPPAGSQIETNFIIYLSCALVLKAVDLLHLLITQLTVSIFLIDWEKPKEKPAFKAPAGGQRATSSVSIWRTFLIANEWNEIQTHRKLNPSLQLFAVLLLLEVVGLKNIASRDLNLDLHPGTDTYLAAWSPVLRFGIAASLWLALGIAQMVFFIGIYERFVEDKIHQFVDLCSMSNVSVFILMHGCYGFYIHGRSVHGHADVGMDAMHACLRKEEENLCPLRGLEANSDIQTFEVLLTDRARQLYDKITQPLTEGPRGASVRVDLHEQRLRSYYALNRFLSSFLEHAYRDMDYIVKDKFFLERIMDMEFQEAVDMSILYTDASALFSRTLFYNNELALLLFDTLLFSVVDLGTQDFMLAAIITFVVQKLVKMLRHALGRRNLAAKTLVEKQFLI
ncbi:unnamed protein product [Eretmochelys imbricata]